MTWMSFYWTGLKIVAWYHFPSSDFILSVKAFSDKGILIIG